MPFDSVVRLIETSAVELSCADFGLRLSNSQGLDILGPLAVIARNAATVLDALIAIARYLHVHSPALRLTTAASGIEGTLRFVFEISELSAARLTQSYELSLANGAHIIRLLGGPGASIAAVSFRHHRISDTALYVETLGCLPRFGQDWYGFEITTELASRTIDTADPETRKIATSYLESEHHPVNASLEGRVADLARRLLATGHCTTDVIAEQMAIHPRTLQRRLAERGTSCHDLIDQERRALASTYLADPAFHLSQIAGLLGYTEQSSLNRSCQRWFGESPRQVRTRQEQARP